jgi:hypothetical protein
VNVLSVEWVEDVIPGRTHFYLEVSSPPIPHSRRQHVTVIFAERVLLGEAPVGDGTCLAGAGRCQTQQVSLRGVSVAAGAGTECARRASPTSHEWRVSGLEGGGRL